MAEPPVPNRIVIRRTLWLAAPLVAGALIALLLSLRNDPPAPKPETSGPLFTPAPSAAPPVNPIERGDVERAIHALQPWLLSAAATTQDPWQLALVTRAVGPDAMLDGETALATLLRELGKLPLKSNELPVVPGDAGANATTAMLAVLLEAGVPLEQQPWPGWSLARWLDQERAAATPVATSRREDLPWFLQVLTLGLGAQTKDRAHEAEVLQNRVRAAFAALDDEHQPTLQFAGQGSAGLQKAGSELAGMWLRKQGLYRLPGNGLLHAQSLLRAVATLSDREQPYRELETPARHLRGALTIRHGLERAMWEQLLQQATGNAGLLLERRAQWLDYCGAMLEAIGWAQRAITPDTKEAQSDPPLDSCVRTVSDLVGELRLGGQAGGPRPADAALIGPVSSALRGLRMLRRQRWLEPGQSSERP